MYQQIFYHVNYYYISFVIVQNKQDEYFNLIIRICNMLKGVNLFISFYILLPIENSLYPTYP